VAILTIADKDNYFPDVSATGQSLVALIQRTQMLVEGNNGANRPLEINQFVQVKPIPSSGVLLMDRTPIINDSVHYPIKVQIRWFASVNNQYYFPGVDDWQTVVAPDYYMDFDTGEIKLRAFFNQYSRFIPSSGYSYSGTNPIARRNRVLGRFQPPQLKVTYYTGFDFVTQPLSNEAQAIKTALGGLVNFLGSQAGQAASQGMSSFQLNNFYTIGYDPKAAMMATSKNAAGSIVEEYLQLFKAYRARSFSGS